MEPPDEGVLVGTRLVVGRVVRVMLVVVVVLTKLKVSILLDILVVDVAGERQDMNESWAIWCSSSDMMRVTLDAIHTEGLSECVGEAQRFLMDSRCCGAGATWCAMVRRGWEDVDLGNLPVGHLLNVAGHHDHSEWCGCDKGRAGHQERNKVEFHSMFCG